MEYLNKSRIEEVLIAILGHGQVTSKLISRIEKILDAIRVEGSYDDPALSEVEEILLCILRGERYEGSTHSRIAAMLKVKANGGEYTEPRRSRVEDLIYEWINDVEYATYEGTLPAILDTKSGYLKSYKIYGNTGGVGEREAVILDEPLNGVGTDNDALNLSNGLLTRKIMKKVFDGTETFATVSSGANKYFRTSIADYPCTNDNNCLCTHFVPRSVASTNTYTAVRTHVPSSSFGAAIAIRPENVSNMSVDDFKAWLASEYNAGTPVTVWYSLETPISTTIDVPQGYTDIIEGYTTQTGTPTQADPIYPECNGEKQQDGTYIIWLTEYDGYKLPITSRVNMWCSELETKVNPSAPEKNYIHITVARDLPAESTIQETGVIYYREAYASTLTSLTIDTPDAVSKQATILTPSGSYGTNLEDIGNGIAFVGYAIIGGVHYYSKVYYYTWDYVKEHEPISFPNPTPVTTDIYIGTTPLEKDEYVDSLSGKIVRIRDVRSELGVSITEPYPTVNASGVGRVTVVKSISWETELTIVETGLIYVKDISNTDELILENVGTHGIDKRVSLEDTREHTLNLTDPDGNGARTVGYAIVTDGTHETTLYTEEAKATYQQLVDEPGQSHLYPGPDDVGGIPDPQNPPVPLPRIPTLDGSTTIDYVGTPKPYAVVLEYPEPKT